MQKREKIFFKLKRFAIVFSILAIIFFTYVEIANRNSINMTYRQKFLKAVYPAFMWFTKLTGTNSKKIANKEIPPPVSFYSLSTNVNNNSSVNFDSLRGKKILLVNTASNCGYTNQYEDLQKLQETYKNKLIVLGFPANDFKEQEKGNDADIAQFCKINFGVTFPLMQKSIVVQSPQQNPVFQWLTDSTKNGWNNKFPTWNFSKYLVNENGILINYFDPSVSPLSPEVITAIEN